MGRLLASPRCGSRPETLGRAAVSLGPDSFALVDQTDRKGIFIKVHTRVIKQNNL